MFLLIKLPSFPWVFTTCKAGSRKTGRGKYPEGNVSDPTCCCFLKKIKVLAKATEIN